MSGEFSILPFLLGAIFVLFIIAVVMYVFHSIGLYVMAKRRGIKNPWLAFIPLAFYYTLGKVAEHGPGMKMKGKFGKYLLTGGIVSFVLTVVTGLAGDPVGLMVADGFVAFVLFGFTIYGYFLILKLTSRNYVVYFVINVFTLFIFMPFFIFGLRNKDNEELFGESEVVGESEDKNE